MPPLTEKNCQKSGKKGKNQEKSGKKEEKLGRKGKNREGSFTLPLLTDRAGYATIVYIAFELYCFLTICPHWML